MDPVVHFEFPYENADRIARFYEQAFGWETRRLGEAMGHYIVVTTGKEDAKADLPRGVIGGGFFPKKPDFPGQHPSVVIAVQDVQAAMKRVASSGGEVLGEPMEIPGVGLYVAFHDTERNRVSLLQPSAAQ